MPSRSPGALSEALELIHCSNAVTRSELTAELRITRSAAGSVVDELSRLGWITVTNQGKTGQTGRPSPVLAVNPQGPAVFGVQVHAQAVSGALIGLGGQIRAGAETALPAGAKPDVVFEAIADLLAQLIEETGEAALAVGVAVPSPVRHADGVALLAQSLRWPAEVAVRDELGGALRRRGLDLAVFVENDANASALAEYRHGSGRGASSLLAVTTARVGVGGSMIVDGELTRGRDGYAMEVGHLSVDPRGKLCSCGNRGCLNVEADLAMLWALTGKKPRSEWAAAARRVLDEAAAGPGREREAIETIRDSLVAGLVSLVNVLNPDRVLLGGLYSEMLAAPQLQIPELVTQRTYLGQVVELEFVATTLEHAGVLGAAEFALEPYLESPRDIAAR